MKNVFKKAAAAVMAFTLLGAGTTFTKTLSPKSVTSITADAAQKNSTKLYKVSRSFTYPIAAVYAEQYLTGTWLDFDISGGNFVMNVNIYKGVMLELNGEGQCVRCYGAHWEGLFFNNFMQYLIRVY